jgi:hypothetical protein
MPSSWTWASPLESRQMNVHTLADMREEDGGEGSCDADLVIIWLLVV